MTVLALAQALFMSVQGMGIATTPLAAYMLLDADHKWLATVPIFLVHLGIMGTTIPASLLMAVIGRRAGFSLGALLGVAAGVVGAVAMYERSFPLLCVATVLQGMQAAFFWYFRLAAADVSRARVPRQGHLARHGGWRHCRLPRPADGQMDGRLAGAGDVCRRLSGHGRLLGCRAGADPAVAHPPADRRGARRRRPADAGIARQPAYRVALAASVCGYAVMTLTMSATPLAMLACGFGFSDSATVIQAHIVAMFLPSFFTGHLIGRIGVLPVIAVGGLIEFGCAIVNLAGIDFANFLIANVLVGLGWNFCFVGGSTLLTTTYVAAERAKVQASHDFVVYASTASAAALSGVLQAKAGWIVINLAALPLMAAVVAAALWLGARQRRLAAAPAE